MSMTLAYAVLAAAILCGIGGQLLLKAGASAPDLLAQLLRPTTMIGLVFYAAAAFFYIIALRKIPVSVAFPSVSLSYAIVAVLGHVLWNEPFGWGQAAGLVMICGGVFVLSYS